MNARRATIWNLIPQCTIAVCALFFTFTVSAQDSYECGIPPGAPPFEAPATTAQAASTDAANLWDFLSELGDRIGQYFILGKGDFAWLAYILCELRVNDGNWRSDEVYVVTLDLDGRVRFHATNMFLAGRLLKPEILAEVYAALGVPSSIIADLSSEVPATAAAARNALNRILTQQPDGYFDATTPSPGIPRAKGHVLAFPGGLPYLTFAGFDLDASHTVDEVIDYGSPSITAADVVDRESLKEFVLEAGRFFQQSFEQRSLYKVWLAMHDPDGPWRDHSVYVYVLDLTTNIIFLHGTNPNRFEWTPLIPTVRDAVTGEFILTQVIEAAKNNVEGGYIRYYFDDPTVDTDNADTPKIGFARMFSMSRQGKLGETSVDVIVGSGYYLTSPAVVELRQQSVMETVLPQMMRSITMSNASAISDRVEQSMSGDSESSNKRFTGLPTFQDVLLSWSRPSGVAGLLSQSMSFTLPVADMNEGSVNSNSLTFWGGVDYRNLSDDSLEVLSYDGSVSNAIVGVDRKLGENFVGGISLSVAQGKTEYMDPELTMGDFSASLTSIHPYGGWQLSENADAWVTFGMGSGEIEFKETTQKRLEDWSLSMIAGGIDFGLMSSDSLLEGGTTDFRLKGETSLSRATVDNGLGDLDLELGASRTRLLFEGAYTRELASGAAFMPTVNTGLRHDGGDGMTGTGLEIGAGLDYKLGRLILTVDSQSQIAHFDADEYFEWSLRSMLAVQPNRDGTGLSLSFGTTRGMVQENTSLGTLGTAQSFPLQVGHAWGKDDTFLSGVSTTFHADVRYGLTRPYGLSLWSSYKYSIVEKRGNVLRLGLQFRNEFGLDSELMLGLHESADKRYQYGNSIGLRSTLHW